MSGRGIEPLAVRFCRTKPLLHVFSWHSWNLLVSCLSDLTWLSNLLKKTSLAGLRHLSSYMWGSQKHAAWGNTNKSAFQTSLSHPSPRTKAGANKTILLSTRGKREHTSPANTSHTCWAFLLSSHVSHANLRCWRGFCKHQQLQQTAGNNTLIIFCWAV